MNDVIIGALALIAGASFCFRGYLAMRLLIPIWGAFVGFSLGAGIVASATGESFLGTFAGWMLGLVLGLAFAAIAYLYYALSVVIVMGSTGFLIGSGLMAALDVRWNWLIVLAGFALGLALALAAVWLDLPMMILVIVTALGGATAMVAGLMLFGGAFSTDDLTRGDIIDRINDEWWWYVLYLVFAIVGVVAQVRSAERLNLTMREAWEGSSTSAGS